MKKAKAYLCLTVTILMIFFTSNLLAEEFTVLDIIKLHEAGLSDDVIIAKIKEQKKKFSLSVDDILSLKKTGISEKVIQAMLLGGDTAAPQPQPGQQPQPQQTHPQPQTPAVQPQNQPKPILDPTGILTVYVSNMVHMKAAKILVDDKEVGMVYRDYSPLKTQVQMGPHKVDVQCVELSFWTAQIVKENEKNTIMVDIKKGQENNYYSSCR